MAARATDEKTSLGFLKSPEGTMAGALFAKVRTEFRDRSLRLFKMNQPLHLGESGQKQGVVFQSRVFFKQQLRLKAGFFY